MFKLKVGLPKTGYARCRSNCGCYQNPSLSCIEFDYIKDAAVKVAIENTFVNVEVINVNGGLTIRYWNMKFTKRQLIYKNESC